MAVNKPVVAILGAGFDGMQVAKDLRDAPVKICLLDQNNCHLFQPLLYQVATAGLSPNEIAGKPLNCFVYHNPVSLATIGRNAAVVRVKRFKQGTLWSLSENLSTK